MSNISSTTSHDGNKSYCNTSVTLGWEPSMIWVKARNEMLSDDLQYCSTSYIYNLHFQEEIRKFFIDNNITFSVTSENTEFQCQINWPSYDTKVEFAIKFLGRVFE